MSRLGETHCCTLPLTDRFPIRCCCLRAGKRWRNAGVELNLLLAEKTERISRRNSKTESALDGKALEIWCILMHPPRRHVGTQRCAELVTELVTDPILFHVWVVAGRA